MPYRVAIVNTETGEILGTGVNPIPVQAQAGSSIVGGSLDVGGVLFENNSVPVVVSRNFLNANTSGANEIVGAQGAGLRIRVLMAAMGAVTANSLFYQSSLTSISATYSLAANGTLVLPYSPHGWFDTDADAALNINLATGTAVGVDVVWCLTF